MLRLLTYVDVLQQVWQNVKDNTPEVTKVARQSSSAKKKSWRGGDQQKGKFDRGKESIGNRNNDNMKATQANNQLNYP